MKCTSTLWLWIALIVTSACAVQEEQSRVLGSGAVPGKPFVDVVFWEPSGPPRDAGPQVITRNILPDSSGGVWLATWDGIMHYDGAAFKNVTVEEGLWPCRTFSLLEDRQGNIWLGTLGAGVYRYDGSSYEQFTTEMGLIGNSITSMAQDGDGNIWFGAMGATKYDGTSFVSFAKEDGFTSSDVNSISPAPDGTLWFGTRGGLFHYDGVAFVNFTETHGLNIRGYIPTLIDRKGHLWFGGGEGVFYFDGEQLRHPIKTESYSIMEDSRGRIWFSGGALKGGGSKPDFGVLNRFDPDVGFGNHSTSLEQFEIHSNGMIFGLAEAKDGSIWFGTLRGAGRIGADSIEYF